jgi:DNA-binding protein HU-beta
LQAASAKGFAAFFKEAEWAKIQKYRIKTGKNGKKPVETGLLPLTKFAKRRKVNGGGCFSGPAWIQGFRVIAQGTLTTAEAGESPESNAIPAQGSGTAKTESGGFYMATALTKTALVRQLAEKLELTNKQSAAFLDLLAETAIKETKKNGVFVIPGLGRLVKAERKARIGRNPQTGEQIKIKAKTVVKFRVAKAAKDVIAPPKK